MRKIQKNSIFDDKKEEIIACAATSILSVNAVMLLIGYQSNDLMPENTYTRIYKSNNNFVIEDISLEEYNRVVDENNNNYIVFCSPTSHIDAQIFLNDLEEVNGIYYYFNHEIKLNDINELKLVRK